MSQSTGKEKKLTKWATGKKCAVKSECKNIEKVQSKNQNVKVACINDMGKTKAMSCSDLSGKLLSTKSGAMKDLIKWVQSSQCTPTLADPICHCEQEVSHYLNIKCIENNIWSCTKSSTKNGNTKDVIKTYKAKNGKKCDILLTKIKCSTTTWLIWLYLNFPKLNLPVKVLTQVNVSSFIQQQALQKQWQSFHTRVIRLSYH